jgi:hypothetical protein
MPRLAEGFVEATLLGVIAPRVLPPAAPQEGRDHPLPVRRMGVELPAIPMARPYAIDARPLDRFRDRPLDRFQD